MSQPGRVARWSGIDLAWADPSFGGEITSGVSNGPVRNSQGMGPSVYAGPGLALQDIVVDGYKLNNGINLGAGIRLRSLGAYEARTLSNARVSGGSSGALNIDKW